MIFAKRAGSRCSFWRTRCSRGRAIRWRAFHVFDEYGQAFSSHEGSIDCLFDRCHHIFIVTWFSFNQNIEIQKQNSALQSQNAALLSYNSELKNQLDELNKSISDIQSTAELKITSFSHSGPISVVFGWTAWDYTAQIENYGKNNVSNGILEVNLMISNGQLIRGVVQLPTLIASESQEIRGHVEGSGVSINFMELNATWQVTLKAPYTVHHQTYK
ncbi:MAG: hypothetical protein ACBZ72_13130 [Candidatus Bathyarchaeia archaeon]